MFHHVTHTHALRATRLEEFLCSYPLRRTNYTCDRIMQLINAAYRVFAHHDTRIHDANGWKVLVMDIVYVNGVFDFLYVNSCYGISSYRATCKDIIPDFRFKSTSACFNILFHHMFVNDTEIVPHSQPLPTLPLLRSVLSREMIRKYLLFFELTLKRTVR